jgi:hypothetical protein
MITGTISHALSNEPNILAGGVIAAGWNNPKG